MSDVQASVWALLAETCRESAPADVWAGLRRRVDEGGAAAAPVPPVLEPSSSRCGRCGKPCPACAAAAVAPAGYVVLPPEARSESMDEHGTRAALYVLEHREDGDSAGGRRPRRTRPVPRQGSGRA